MKRIKVLTVLFACGLLAMSAPLFAQPTPTPSDVPSTSNAPKAPNWFSGKADMMLLGHDDVTSSKYQEYREVPEGMSLPIFSLQGRQSGNDFAIFGRNVSKKDQRYFGYGNVGWLGVAFDYNQIPHQMGNNGEVFFSETAPGVWSMSGALRGALGSAVDAVSATARTYPFYDVLLGSTLQSSGFVNLTSLRQRGNVALDLGRQLPFDLAVTYMREEKTGYRGASGGNILGVVTSVVNVPESMDEVTQDFGVRWAYTQKAANVYATFNRNIYNDRLDALVIDNPFRATDRAYVSTAVPGGPAASRFSTSPDNEASRAAFGAMLKFKRQTRITADVAIGRWTQDAQFLPFTINTAILTPSGANATSTSVLPRQSLNGKIDTTSLNVGFSSRPTDDLSVRLRYRSYDLTNKTSPISWLGGTTAGSPDRSWTTATASADAPYGYATANLYDNTTKRFDAQVGYDIKDLTLEAAFRTATLDRTAREATSGKDNGYALSAVYNAREWVEFRLMYDWLHRTANGETFYGFQADEAERKTNRVGVDVELMPSAQVGFNFAYFRKKDDYPDRPNRVAASGGAPIAGAQPIPNTPSGLLEASYDTYTVGVDYTPGERAELSAYYTYEKNAQTNQWSTTNAAPRLDLNNLLNYAGSDKGNTFGLNGVFHVVPEKWTFSAMVRHQKVNGLMDITANETGTFYNPGRTTLVAPGQGGALDINDFDDTQITSAIADVAYAFNKSLSLSVGWAYDKYTHADAFTDFATTFPQTVLFFLNENNGNYTANAAFTRLIYRF